MSDFTIRAQKQEDGGYIGFVDHGRVEVAMVACGYLTEQEALRAANEKRQSLKAAWYRRYPETKPVTT